MTPTPPVRILRFGAGNFLRAFVDWRVQGLNSRAGWIHSHNLKAGLHGTLDYRDPAQPYGCSQLGADEVTEGHRLTANPLVGRGDNRFC